MKKNNSTYLDLSLLNPIFIIINLAFKDDLHIHFFKVVEYHRINNQ